MILDYYYYLQAAVQTRRSGTCVYVCVCVCVYFANSWVYLQCSVVGALRSGTIFLFTCRVEDNILETAVGP